MSSPFFDTNIVIDWLLHRAPAYVELKLYNTVRISRIAWAEVLAGEPVDTREAIKHLLSGFDIVEVDETIATIAVDFRYRTQVKLLDALIYATAQRHGALLITRNTKDFSPDLPGVRVPYTLSS